MRDSIGVLLAPTIPPGGILDVARQVDFLGFDTLWVVEDCFCNGGIAQAAAILAATSRVTVGIGILPAAARNPAFAAMEIATLAGIFPGRIVVGIGHGMPGWIRQVGAWPSSPLMLLSETLQTVGALLNGETVTTNGRYLHLDGVKLAYPPAVVPKILAGVRGPRSLQLAGRLADGVILAEPVTPEYLTAVREQMGRGSSGDIVAYNVAAVGDDAASAITAARPALQWIGDPDWAAHLVALPFAAEFAALRRRSATREDFAAALPDAWVEQLAVVGTAQGAQERIAQLHAAGAGEVVLSPAGDDPVASIRAFAALVPAQEATA